MPRYILVEGSYHGTSDDVAGTWYVVDGHGGLIDKRGIGFASRREALASLVEDLSWIVDLVSVAEIAARAKVAVPTVQSWRRRHADFPAPLVILAAAPVWAWDNVAAWIARPRKRGRL